MTAGWPTKVTYADGDVWSASDINSTNGTLNYIDPTSAVNGQSLVRDSASGGKVKWGRPGLVGAYLYKGSAQSIPNATWTAVTFSNEVWDTDSFHNTSTNTSRITIPTNLAGKYQFNSRGFFDGNASGIRYLSIYKNGSGAAVNYYQGASGGNTFSINTILDAAAGDYFEVYLYQNSGGALNYNAGVSFGNLEGEFSCNYVGA